jgi:ubiquinol-cytochrome c reductase cytochrome b subunit
VDEHGHPIPLEYQGAPVPKKMNKLGSAGSPVPGSLLTPDPESETLALAKARANGHGGGAKETHAIDSGDDPSQKL